MKKRTIKEEKPYKIPIVLHTEFRFAIYQNAVNVCIAIAQAGYFVQVKHQDSSYLVSIYKINND